jgi:hypothetical protein
MAMSMDMNSIASMVEGGAGLAEGIYGYLQGQEGKKEMESLLANYPKLEMQQGYKDYLNIIKSQAGGKMPGYYTAMGNIDATTGQSIGSAKEGALSSSQFLETLGKLDQQSLAAKNQLNVASSQYQADTMKALAEANYKYGDLQTQIWGENVKRLWDIKMNMAQSKYNQGVASVQSGVDTFVQSGFDFAGSSGSSGSSSSSGSSFMGL